MSKLVVTLDNRIGLLNGLHLTRGEVVVKTGKSRVLTSAGKWRTLAHVRDCMDALTNEFQRGRCVDNHLDHIITRNVQILAYALSSVMARKYGGSLIGFPAVQYLLGKALYLMRAGHHGMIAGAWSWKPGPPLESYRLNQSMAAALVSCLDAELRHEKVGERDLTRISGCIESEEGAKWRKYRNAEMRAEIDSLPEFTPDENLLPGYMYWRHPALEDTTIRLDDIKLCWIVRRGATGAVMFENTASMVAFVTGRASEETSA